MKDVSHLVGARLRKQVVGARRLSMEEEEGSVKCQHEGIPCPASLAAVVVAAWSPRKGYVVEEL